MRKVLLRGVVLLVFAFSLSAYADTITFETSPTLGCFSQTSTCTPTVFNPATFEYIWNTTGPKHIGTIDFLGTGTGVSITTNVPPSYTFNLGGIAISDPADGNPPANQTIAGYFDVKVVFSIPSISGGNPTFNATFAGTITKNLNGTVTFDFGAAQPLSYTIPAVGNGSFNLTVNDLTVPIVPTPGGSGQTDYGTGTLTATISDAVYTPDTPSAPVPEPATLLLLGSGFVGIAGLLRRRRS